MKFEFIGDEISIEKQFTWNQNIWHIPSIYITEDGLTVDYCIEIAPDRIKQYVEKWESVGGDANNLSIEEQEALLAENPLYLDFHSKVSVNNAEAVRGRGCSIPWIPENIRPKEAAGTHHEAQQENREAQRQAKKESQWQSIMQRYQLDPEKGWVLHRCSYDWGPERKPMIRSLSVTLQQAPTAVTESKLHSPKVGDRIITTHPVTGTRHVITIQSLEKQELDVSMHRKEYEYPTHFVKMSYTLLPELSKNEFTVSDCGQGDRPRRKPDADGAGAAEIGIVRGAGTAGSGMTRGTEGPIAIFVAGGNKEPKLHSAVSSLHFAPVEEIEWKIVYQIKACEDIKVDLIG